MAILTEHVDRYLQNVRPDRSRLMAEMEKFAETDHVPIVHWETGRFLATLVRATEPALVLEVGLPTASEDTDDSGNFTQRQGVPVTFALPVEESLRLAYAESFSEKLRLALRGRGDEASLQGPETVFQPTAGSSS